MPELTAEAPARRPVRYQLDTGAGAADPGAARRQGQGGPGRGTPRRPRGFEPAPDRPDPVALLEEQAVTRVPDLVPVR